MCFLLHLLVERFQVLRTQIFMQLKTSQKPHSNVSCPCEVRRKSWDYVFPHVLCVVSNLVRQEKQIGHTLCSSRKMQLQMSSAANYLIITKYFS